MSKKEREICEFQMDLNNYFCLRSNLSSDNIICSERLGLKRVWRITFFGLKSGQDLKNRTAQPQQEFPYEWKKWPRQSELSSGQMLSLRGLRNLLACLVGKTPLIFVVELYDSYVSSGESACSRACSPDMIHGVNKFMSFRELRNFLTCLVFYKSTCILGTGQ